MKKIFCIILSVLLFSCPNTTQQETPTPTESINTQTPPPTAGTTNPTPPPAVSTTTPTLSPVVSTTSPTPPPVVSTTTPTPPPVVSTTTPTLSPIVSTTTPTLSPVVSTTSPTPPPAAGSITVTFRYGENATPYSYKNIYVIWMENKSLSFLQNIHICQKLVSGGLSGTVLPYWKINRYPGSEQTEIDAVTGATQANMDFTVSADLKDQTIREFRLYFEIDRAYEPNDWFEDQPALLYAVDINLDDPVTEYELLPAGWTPHETNQNVVPGTPLGEMQAELRYITHHKDGESFGLPDDNRATKMVGGITVRVE